MTSEASADLELMRASMLLDSDPASAARHASNILANSPEHEEAKLLLAAACRRLGDSAVAVSAVESLARAHPGSPVMQLELGRVYADCGRRADAVAAFARAVELDPELADAWSELATQHFISGDTAAGDSAYLNYSQRAPNPQELVDAGIALSEGRLDAAEALVRRRLRDAPRSAEALLLQADIDARREDWAQAEKYLLQCLACAPGYAAARYALARVFFWQERIAEALPLIERLLATEPRNKNYLSLKAQSLRFVGRHSESVALLESLLLDHPEDPEVWVTYGNLLREIGEQSRAIDSYRQALAVQPGFGEAYWALANLKTFRFDERDLQCMQQQLVRSEARGRGRIHLEFALGKAFEDAKQFAASFEHYAAGNALFRNGIEYDPASSTAFVQRSKAVYTARFFADRSGWGDERPDPIFIIGLPRSGSTLIEQILASHSQIEGTRELRDIPNMVSDLMSRLDRSAKGDYPEPIASLDAAEIQALAARYFAQTQPRRPMARPRFVDKMLGNFSHFGLIHLMFPNSAIVDARRHPLGCGFSCYKQLFARGMRFSFDLGELGLYYRDYAELMEHVDNVLPGRVHRIHYEQLVADPEREVRRLLDYCQLPFEAECLRFYKNRRIVHTISSEQVRLPIYSGSVEQWRHFEPWLGPMKNALGNLVDQYPIPDRARA
ncbi:MAG: sulfotransferase [Gammaproteobacteria bacterium]